MTTSRASFGGQVWRSARRLGAFPGSYPFLKFKGLFKGILSFFKGLFKGILSFFKTLFKGILSFLKRIMWILFTKRLS